MVSMEGRAWAAGYIKPQVDPKVPGVVGTPFINNFSKTLNWTAPKEDGSSPITGYSVHAVSTGGKAGAWTPDAKTLSVDMSTMLADKKKYTGSVAAVNKNGTGPQTSFSGELGYPSAAPKPLVKGFSGNSIQVQLSCDPADNDLTLTIDVQWKKSSDSTWTTKTNVADLYDITPLLGGTAYDIQSRCCNVNGIGAWSVTVSQTTPDTVCRPPVVTKVVPIDFGGIVEWTYSGTVEPEKFRMRATDGTNVTTKDVDSPETDGVIDGLKNGTEYTVTVTAINAKGEESAPSNAMKVTPVAPQIPAPVLATAVGGDGKITFTFSKAELPTDRTLKHYSWEAVSVENASDSYSGYIPLDQFTDCVAVVPNDKTWTFRLFTVTTLDEASDPSNSLEVHTEKPIAPYKPRLNGCKLTDYYNGQVELAFSPGVGQEGGRTGPADITAWKVRQQTDTAGIEWLDILDGAARTFTTPKVPLGTAVFQVVAINAVGQSELSNPMSVTYTPTDNRPFTSDKAFNIYQSENYYFASFDPGNDVSKTGWDVTWNCTRTESGKDLEFDVLLVGAGGGAKGQTLTLGKGGNGGGGELVYSKLPATNALSKFTVFASIGGATGIDSHDSKVTEGAAVLTGRAGKSATDKNDAAGYPLTKVDDPWLECFTMFGWLIPDSYSVGGVAIEGKQYYPNGLIWGQAGAGTKTSNGGRGVEGIVLLRWAKTKKTEMPWVPEGAEKKRRRKWFGR